MEIRRKKIDNAQKGIDKALVELDELLYMARDSHNEFRELIKGTTDILLLAYNFTERLADYMYSSSQEKQDNP